MKSDEDINKINHNDEPNTLTNPESLSLIHPIPTNNNTSSTISTNSSTLPESTTLTTTTTTVTTEREEGRETPTESVKAVGVIEVGGGPNESNSISLPQTETVESNPSTLESPPTSIDSVSVKESRQDVTEVEGKVEEEKEKVDDTVVATNEVLEEGVLPIAVEESKKEVDATLDTDKPQVPLSILEEPIPISLLSTTPPAALSSSSNPTSTTSTPTLTAAVLPSAPNRSGSPALPVKKFASSLSVNKKFLEKAAEKSKPEVKAAVARLATPPIAPVISTTHPRLLTGKITMNPTTAILAAAQAASGVNGWLKNVAAAENNASGAPRSVSMDMGRGAFDRSGRGGLGGGMGLGSRSGSGSRGPIVWGSGSRHSGSMDSAMGMGGDFPTAAEAANAKSLRAAALIEQIQSRDRAIQARAAAAAAANAHLLEGLDAFRGLHLDPNASHWDEMGDEDNDFLDDTIEFGDGTQYKIDAEAPPPPATPSGLRNEQYLDEPDPSDFATLEAPLAPGESPEEDLSNNRGERFQDDYDRSWSKKPVPNDGKNLFNERLGKFEPYGGGVGGKKGGPIPGSILTHAPEDTRPRRLSGADYPPHLDRPPHHSNESHAPRRPSITSPRMEKATLPPRRESAWGRDQHNVAGSGPVPRRSSIEQGTRRPSIDQTMRKPSIDLGGRQLPPHLAGIQQSPRSTTQHDLPPHRSPPQTRPPPSLASVVSPPPLLPPLLAPIAVVPISANQPIPDLEELHSREMHAAAERAKKRRQEEEEVRMEQVERARKKAAELEEKARILEESKAAAISEASKPVTAVPLERTDPWRKPFAPPKLQHPPPPPPPAPAPVKLGPTKILTRETPLPTSTVNTTTRPTIPHEAPLPVIESKAPLRPEQKLWRRGDPPPTTNHRQPPPHLATASTKVGPSPSLSVVVEPTIVESSITSPQSHVASPVNGSRKVNDVIPPHKIPTISVLEDVMSRVKGAMKVPSISSPTSTTFDSNDPTSRPDSFSPPSHPTVKLPGSLPSLSSTPLPTPSSSSSSTAAVLPKGPRGRSDVRPPTTHTFENRDALPLFEATRGERSQSPPPAWKVYPVRMAVYPTLQLPAVRFIKAMASPGTPSSVISLSYNPRTFGAPRYTREDFFFPKKYFRGVVIKSIRLPSRRIIQNDMIVALPLPPPPAPEPNWRRDPIVVKVPVEEPVAVKVSIPVSIPMRSTPSTNSVNFHATTAPQAASLFDPSPVLSRASPSTVPSVLELIEKTPVPTILDAPIALDRSDPSRLFMVTGQLNGEKIDASRRESLAAPGADLVTAPTVESTSTHFDPTFNARPTTPTQSWPTPLSLSVLDPTIASVWSSPPTETPTHARSISLGGIKLENSLHGIADDDFQPAIPTTLADLKTEDVGVKDEIALRNRTESDEAKLRAVAPSFPSSFQESSSPGQQFRRQQQEPFNRQQPPHSQFSNPVNYSSRQPFMPPQPLSQSQSPHYLSQQASHLYTNSFTPPSQSGAPSYSMSNYSQNSYSPISPANNQASHHFPNYRTPSLTNTSVVSQSYGASNPSYGPVGPIAGGGSYGAVGAGGMNGVVSGGLGGVRNLGGSPYGRSPSINGSYPQQQQQYGNSIGYRVGEAGAFSSPQPDSRFTGRLGGGSYTSSMPSPVTIHSHLQTQPSFSSPFTNQLLQQQQQLQLQQQQLQRLQQQQLLQQQQQQQQQPSFNSYSMGSQLPSGRGPPGREPGGSGNW